MNYKEIRTLYDNVENNELVTQTAYEFELFDDYYYRLFYSYSETKDEEIDEFIGLASDALNVLKEVIPDVK